MMAPVPTQITIDLTPVHKQVSALMETGSYESVEELVQTALFAFEPDSTDDLNGWTPEELIQMAEEASHGERFSADEVFQRLEQLHQTTVSLAKK